MNKVKVQIGEQVCRYDGLGQYYTLIVTNRTPSTIATKHIKNGCNADLKGRLSNFRYIDNKANMQRLIDIQKHVKELEKEAKNIYLSMPEIE